MSEKKETFEEKLANLEEIVKSLETGEVPLDDAINKFNVAMKLSNELNKTLEDASNTINKVINKDDTIKEFKIEE